MPLYQGQGEDGFFLVRAVRRSWLGFSAWLRGTPIERLLHWLPGVSRHPQDVGGFLVDQHRARWLALQLFHLLGYTRKGKRERILHMRRRNSGTGSIADRRAW